jgi:hypothetical protein
MDPARRAPAFVLYVLGLLLCLPLALAQAPESKVNYFDNLPARLFFFEDTTVRRLRKQFIAHSPN